MKNMFNLTPEQCKSIKEWIGDGEESQSPAVKLYKNEKEAMQTNLPFSSWVVEKICNQSLELYDDSMLSMHEMIHEMNKCYNRNEQVDSQYRSLDIC